MNVILTGVSRGLGSALFAAFQARGDRLLAIGRRFTPAQEKIAAAEPDRIRLHAADLADSASLPGTAEFRQFLDQSPTQAVLLHNAAVVSPIGAVGALPPAEVAAAIAVNLTAPIVLTDAFLAVAPRPAKIIFVSSGAAHRVIGGFSVYCATKAAGEMFVACVAEQFAADPGVTAVNVNPGQMDTGMQADIRAAGTAGAYFPDRHTFVDRHARGEMPDPAIVAADIIAAHCL
jgi:benzil reductase ((S)-benzoin forming)